MSTTVAGRRPLRADAQANRERILDIAEEVFGQGGESAPTEEVARRAQQAGAVRGDVELREVYALLAGVSWATARARFDEQGRAKLLALVFDSLAPR